MVYQNQREVEKIQAEYARRNALDNKQYNLLYSPSAHLVKFRRGYEINKLLKGCFLEGLENVEALDVGCGSGSFLGDLRTMGAKGDRLFGIDLSEERIEAARSLYPAMNFELGEGDLPYEDEKFDLVSAFTVFSSIMDDGFRKGLAQDMLRVTKSGSYILLYDFGFDNPKNDKVRAFTAKQVEQIFPNTEIKSVKLTLAPPIARRLSKISLTLTYLVERLFPILRTHRLFLIKRN